MMLLSVLRYAILRRRHENVQLLDERGLTLICGSEKGVGRSCIFEGSGQCWSGEAVEQFRYV